MLVVEKYKDIIHFVKSNAGRYFLTSIYPYIYSIVNHIKNNNLHTKNYMFVIIPKNFKSPDDIADTIMSSIEEK